MENQITSRKILVLLGSPRKKGNSALLTGQIIKGAEAAGAEVESIYLHGMQIAPCQSCYKCQKSKSEGCAIDDDMQAIYPKLKSADTWVIASPVFWFTMCAQTKLFMDRCFAFPAYCRGGASEQPTEYDTRGFSGKRIGIAMSYGDTDPFTSGCVNALRTFQDAFRYVGAEIVGMVYGSALGAGEIAKNESLMQQAEKFGKKLARL